MIRELLEEFFDSGELPNQDKTLDPFWDPPNPLLVGQSFLSLQPLGIQFENELSAAILSIDGHGGKQGELQVAYKPSTDTGDTNEENLPEEFTVDKSEDLLGKKDLYFKVYIHAATNLPEATHTNPFVTYQFKFEQDNIYQTKETVQNTSSPKFEYENLHRIEEVTAEIIEELNTGSISFQVYAYPPSAANAPKEDGGMALKKRMTMKKAARGDYEIDADTEAKLLGTEAPDQRGGQGGATGGK